MKQLKWLVFVFSMMVVLAISSTSARAENVGVWINDLNHVNKGKASSIAQLCQRNHISYIIVRTHKPWDNGHKAKNAHWYRLCPEKNFKRLLKECHKRHIKVYAWMYIYGNDDGQSIELAMAKQAISAGCDGFVLNAETEFTKQERYDNALALCGKIRQFIEQRKKKGKNCILAYSTFARSDVGRGYQFPYAAFNKYCDQVWLQSYWATFNWEPGQTVTAIDVKFRNKYRKWIQKDNNDGKHRSRIPWIHTAQAYSGKGRTEHIPSKELSEFLETARKAGHKEVNVYTLDYMSTEHLNVIRKFATERVAKNVSPYGALVSKGSKQVDVADLRLEEDISAKAGPKFQDEDEEENKAGNGEDNFYPLQPLDSEPIEADITGGFWAGWVDCLTFHPPWWDTWTSHYWIIALLIIALVGIISAFTEIDVITRRRVIAVGSVTGLSWPLILTVAAFAVTACISLAVIAGVVIGAVLLREYIKPSKPS